MHCHHSPALGSLVPGAGETGVTEVAGGAYGAWAFAKQGDKTGDAVGELYKQFKSVAKTEILNMQARSSAFI